LNEILDFNTVHPDGRRELLSLLTAEIPGKGAFVDVGV